MGRRYLRITSGMEVIEMKGAEAVMLIALLTLLPILSTPVSAEDGGLKVVATIPDLSLIAREVGGERVSVSSVMPPGADPHSFSMTRDDRELLDRADLIVLANSALLHVEENIRENYGGKEILDFSDYRSYGADLKDLPSCSDCPHGYWLYFDNTLAIAKAIRDRLVEMDPDGSAYYTLNYEEFEKRVERAKADIVKTSKDLDLYGKSVVTAVPGVNYVVLNMGMRVGASLLKEGSGFVSGGELAEIEKNLGIVCPESMKEAKAGQLSEQISRDTGAPTVYVKFIVSEDVADPISLQYYNMASMKGLSYSPSTSSALSTTLLIIVIIFLALLAAGEAYIIYRMRVNV